VQAVFGGSFDSFGSLDTLLPSLSSFSFLSFLLSSLLSSFLLFFYYSVINPKKLPFLLPKARHITTRFLACGMIGAAITISTPTLHESLEE
jgi:hypothetical protein